MAGVDFTILILSPRGYAHHHAFDEIALGLGHGLVELGWRVHVSRDPRDCPGRVILLGANLLSQMPGYDPPADAALFNLEQLEERSPWLDARYRAALRTHEVWDYSPLNLDFLARLGCPRARLCPIGHVAKLSRIPVVPETLDVLLYGSQTPRRTSVLEALAREGFNVVPLFGVYGMERDAYIAQARIVLNLHLYPARLFEIVRVSYLLANRRFVVSETGADAALEEPYRQGVAFAAYEDIVATCRRYLGDPAGRATIAEAGHRVFTARPQSLFLLPLVGRKAT
jgi:hypothetical protein